MEYINQLSSYITLEFTLLALSIGFALTFMMALSAMRSRRNATQLSAVGAESNPQMLDSVINRISHLENEIRDMQTGFETIKTQLPQTSLVRFNPFRDSGVGGNQSFSLAQVDKQGNGSVITHLFSREMSRVSAKRIINWQSEQELSPEEKQALDQLR